MNNLWILAAAEEPAGEAAGQQGQGEVVKSEEVVGTTAVQTTTSTDGSAPAGKEPPRGPQSFPWTSIVMMGVLFLMMYMVLFRGPKKKQQEHEQMVKSLKKNDRVRTIGGILGTVIDIKENEIVLKVDESNNTKIRVIPSAIHVVLSDKAD